MRLRSRHWMLACVAAGVVFVLGALWLAGLHYIEADRALAVAAAERENANLALTLAEENSRTLRGVERGLRAFARQLAETGSPPSGAWADSRVMHRILFIDAQGRGRSPDVAAIDFAEREFFLRHRANASGGAHVGTPILSRVSNAWIIPVSIRVSDRDGRFAGVVVAGVKPEYFAQLYAQPQLGSDSCVALVGTDGIVRAKRRGGQLSYGGEAGTSLMPRQREAPMGRYVERQPDGVVRHVHYQTLPDYPSLVLAVGRSEAYALADHAQRERIVLAMLVLASGVVLLVAGFIGSALEKQRVGVRDLRRSEERYRDLYENAVEGIFQVAPEGRYITANAAMARIAGFATPADLIRGTRHVRERYLDPARRADFQSLIDAAGRVSDFQYELVRADGSTAWVSENARAVRDEDGRLLRYEGFLTDITARRHEEQLRQEAAELALRRYRALLERLGCLAGALKAAGDLPSICGAVLEFARASAPLAGMFVWVDEPGGGLSCVFAWAEGCEMRPASAPDPHGEHARAIASGETVVTPSALVVPLRAMGAVLGAIELRSAEPGAYREEHRVALGAAAPFVGMAMHNVKLLAEEREHRERAEHAERRTAAVLDSALDAIVTIDHEDRIVDFNPAAERLFGVLEKHVHGQRLADVIIPPELRARHQIALARLVSTGESGILDGRVELTAMRAGGETFPVEVSVVRIPGVEPPVFTGFVRDITERRRAEAALRESEARYRKTADELGELVDGSIDAICTMDREGRFVRVSAASRLIWGLEPEELVGTCALDRVHPDDLDATREAMATLLEGAPMRGFENRHLRKDGSVVHITWSARWREHEQMVFCVARDVSEGKLMAEANRHLAERLRQTLENLASGFATVDAAWRLTYVNRQVERTTGLRRGDMLGRTLWDAVPGLVGSTFEAEYRRAMAERVPAQLEAFVGSYGRWFEARVYPTSDGGLAIYFTDVSDRRQALARLHESERRFEHVALATSDAIWDYDIASGRVWRSVGMTKLFGYAPDEVEETLEAWAERLHPQERQRVVSSTQEAIASGATRWTGEYRFLRRDGTYALVEDRASIMRDAEGRPYRVVGGMSDITERRELERQLVRTQRLESLGTLAGGIAHDLNNVLTPIMMGVSLLDGDELDAERRAIVETIRMSANRGAEMVRQVLSFARGMEGQRVEIRARHVIDEVERMIRDTFPRNVEIAMRAQADLPVVLGDPTQLHQVILNLCLNARDAMAGGGVLTVAAGVAHVDAAATAVDGEVAPGRYVCIDVIDTGCGMDDAVLDRIFDPFFTTKAPGEGTGLGLPTTLAIVRRHGGHIQVHSRPGAGTTFRVLLPASEGAVPEPPSAGQKAGRAGRGETVMVVDDEASIRTMAGNALATAGYRVVTAANGAEALAAWRAAARVDLVVTDMMMPVMGGEELVRELAMLDAGVPVVCTSGIAAAAARGCAGRPHAFLAKPYTAEALVATVQDALA